MLSFTRIYAVPNIQNQKKTLAELEIFVQWMAGHAHLSGQIQIYLMHRLLDAAQVKYSEYTDL